MGVPQIKDLKNIDILLIEDNSNDCDFILRIFDKNNIKKVEIVNDAENAVEFLKNGQEKNIKLIILDIKLPRISGLEVLKMIKENRNTRKIPVVIFSSSEEYKDIDTAYFLGANSFITKPVSYIDFTKVVTEIINYWIFLNKSC